MKNFLSKTYVKLILVGIVMISFVESVGAEARNPLHAICPRPPGPEPIEVFIDRSMWIALSGILLMPFLMVYFFASSALLKNTDKEKAKKKKVWFGISLVIEIFLIIVSIIMKVVAEKYY